MWETTTRQSLFLFQLTRTDVRILKPFHFITMAVIPAFKEMEDPPPDFCQNCSMHGVKYVKHSQTLTEKIFWAITIFVSFVYCTILIWNIYQKRLLNPVIISFDETPVPIWQVNALKDW